MRQFEIIDCVIAVREEYQGRKLRSSISAMNEKQVRLRASWLMDEDDLYPGEFALHPCTKDTQWLFDEAGIAWIASGDVRVI